MALYAPTSAGLYLDMEREGTAEVTVKIQESRNCDVDPGWRTVRVLHGNDFPFKGTVALNPESHMIKILPASLSSSKIKVKDLVIGDENWNFGSGFEGISEVAADQIPVNANNGTVTVSGVPAGKTVRVYDVAGRLVAQKNAEGPVQFVLTPGLYLVSVDNAVVKVSL